MSEDVRYLVVIPARGGSKGIPGKNLRVLAGKPLIAWTIEHALQAATPCRIVVSTDSEEIAAVATKYGAEVPFLRPDVLATDEAPTEPSLLHALDTTPSTEGIEHVILLQPTSPIRQAGALDAAVELYERTSADSLVSTSEAHPFLWHLPTDEATALYDFRNRPRRQDLTDEQRLFKENGSIYITKRGVLTSTGNRLGGRVAMYVMSVREGIEIDDPLDFEMIEFLLTRGQHVH